MDRRAFIAGFATTAAVSALPVLPVGATPAPAFELTSETFQQGEFPLVQFSQEEINTMLSQLADRAAQHGVNVLAMPAPVHIHNGVTLEAMARAYKQQQAITEVFNHLPAGTRNLHVRSFYRTPFLNETTFQPDRSLVIRYAVS